MLRRVISISTLLAIIVCSQASQACSVVAGVSEPVIYLGWYGYNTYTNSGPVIGSISGAGLPSGRTIISVMQIGYYGGWRQYLVVSGFTSSPGQSYFNSFTLGARTFLSSAATYEYGNGVALWSWEYTPYAIEHMVANQTYSCSVNF
jgi:hypothetical protein